MSRHLAFAGDHPVYGIATFDRGMAYGDGLFETMRAHAGAVPWWPRHWNRLSDGARRLRLGLPPRSQVEEAMAVLLEGGAGVVRLVVSRGAGGRGYAPSPVEPAWGLSVHPLPPVQRGLVLRWCRTHLAIQPALAGMKHCNRLEQVIARLEWDEADDADEGLMLDTCGDVVSAVAGNVFVLRDGEWLTPPVDRCGVRGVCREWALGELGAREHRLRPVDVETAGAVFVCNAVRGILAVDRLGNRTWAPHPHVERLRARLAASHPAFASLESP